MRTLFLLPLCLLSCSGPYDFECDDEVASLYPRAQITIIDGDGERIYVIDRRDAVRCSTSVPGNPEIHRTRMCPWAVEKCRILRLNNRENSAEYKRYSCAKEKE
jgi:hypothetical protein